jgi:hypothetical protein
MEPVEVQESFNLVRQRINQAITGTNREGVKANDKDRNRPLHTLSFKTMEGGRIAPAPEHVIGVGSDTERDEGGEE